MKTFAVSIAVLFIWTACGDGNQPIIDREALVERRDRYTQKSHFL